MRISIVAALLLISSAVFSQRTTKDTTFNGRFVAVSSDAAAANDSVEAFFIIHGKGEVGTTTNYTHNYGPQFWLDNGWNGNVVMNNGTHRPMYITIQLSTFSTATQELKGIVDQIIARYPKIKRNGRHAMGLSQGGFQWGQFLTYLPSAGNYSYPLMFKSFVNLAGVRANVNNGALASMDWRARFGHIARVTGLKLLGFQGTTESDSEVWNVAKYMNDSINAVMPGVLYAWNMYVTYGGGAHCCWNDMYNPGVTNWNLTNSNVRATRNGATYSNFISSNQNIYRWAINQGDSSMTTAGTPVNQPPVANAGPDQNITLPTSTATLAGSFTDDSAGVTVLWTKLSGSGNITTPTSLTSGITGLTAGASVFRLTVTDFYGLTSSDNMTITTANQAPPTVSAGADRTLQLPTTQLTLTGTASSTGSIASRQWSQVNGPGTITFGTPTANSTTATFPTTPGLYTVVFSATDNLSTTSTDTATINVIAAQTGEERRIFISLYGGSNGYVNAEWNLWNVLSSPQISNVNYTTGTASTVSVTLSQAGTVQDNGGYSGSTDYPVQVLRYSSVWATSGGARTMTITGLNPGKLYSFEFVPSRKATSVINDFTISGQTQSVQVSNNYGTPASFTDIAPNSSGVVVVSMAKQGSSGGTFLNAMKITEQGTGIIQNQPPTANAGADQFLTTPLDSAMLVGNGSDPDGVIVSYSWTQVSGPDLAEIVAPGSASTRVRSLDSIGDYVFNLRVTDDSGAVADDQMVIHVNSTDISPVSVSAGQDTSIALAQYNDAIGAMDNTKSVLRATGTSNITSWSWTKISGGGVTFGSPSSQNTTIENLEGGNYAFRVVASNGSSSAADTILYRVVDYQKKGERPCRVGAPVVWNLTPTSNTELTRIFLVRDGYDIRGGDTIKIPRNPNNGGNYVGISLGGFGGSAGCPVIVMNKDTVVTVSNGTGSTFFRFGSTANAVNDSNYVAHVRVLGNLVPGIPYGFQNIDPDPATKNAIGLVGGLVTDFEVAGLAVKGASTGIMIKQDPDSSRPWRIYNNFRQKNIVIHDNYMEDINGEGFYIGVSSPASIKASVRLDSVTIYNNIFNRTTWDAMQVSYGIYTNIHDNITMYTGTANIGSQRAILNIGGNTRGRAVGNIFYNGKESVGLYGYGVVEVGYNYIDSVSTGSSTADGIYIDARATGPGTNIYEQRDSMRVNIHHNVFNRIERRAIFGANNAGVQGAGVIRDNKVIEPSRTLSYMISSSKDVLTNNTLATTGDVVSMRTISTFGEVPVIAITKNGVTQNFTTASGGLTYLGVLSGVPPVVPLNRVPFKVRRGLVLKKL